MKTESGACWNCGAALDAGDYRRGDLCAQCHFETRCCRNCDFYDPARNNQCRESAADLVADKEKSNFCEYFRPTAKPRGAARSGWDPAGASSSSSAKTAFDALFKKKS